MPDLNTIIQRMKDAGEDDQAINDVVEEFNRQNPPKPIAPPAPPTPAEPVETQPRQPVQRVSDKEPGTYREGFWESMFGSPFDKRSALNAGLRGGASFLQGAVADIPETLLAMGKDALSLFSNPEQLLQAREAFTEGIPAVARGVYEAGEASGADPESFGRVMGQLTGQPAILGKVGPPATRTLGRGVEAVGRVGRQYQPLSGLIPRVGQVRTLRNIERGVGGMVERTGQRMRGTYVPPEAPPATAGVGADYGNIQGAAGKVPGFWTKQRSLRNPRGIGVKPSALTTPSRNQPVPYEPNPLQQDIGGAPGEFVTPEPVEGNILAQPPQGAASRTQPIPFENQGPRPVPEPGGAPGEFDLTQPITDTPYLQPDYSGIPPSRNQPIPFEAQGPRPIPEPGAPLGEFDLTQPVGEPIPVQPERGIGNRPPSRLQDMPFEPTPEPLPPGEFDLAQPIEGTIPIQGMENAPVPSRLMEMPFEPTPEPLPPGEIDLTTPIESTIPLGEASEVVPSRLRDMPYTPGEYTEAAAATGPKPRPAGASVPRSAAASKFEPSIKPEPVKTPGGDVIDPATGELLDEATTSAVTEALSSEAETPASIIERSNLPEAAKATLLDRINKFFSEENVEGSARMPSWAERVAEKLVGRKNPLTPEIPEGQVSNRRMFDLSGEVGAANTLAAESERFASQVTRPGTSEFAPDLVAQSENVLSGTSPTFKPRQSFEDIQARIYELMDKDAAGTLTGAELAEAQQLNKQWRNHPEFGKDVPRGSFAPEPESSTMGSRFRDLMEDETGAIKKTYPFKARGERILQGKKFPVFGPEDIGQLRQTNNIREAYLSDTMPASGKPKDLIFLDMGNGEVRPFVDKGPKQGAVNKFFGSEEGSAKVPDWADKVAGNILKLIDKPNLPTQLYEAAMTPLRRAASSIGKMINDDFSALPDDEWRVKFAKTKGEHLSMDLRELGDWANKQGGMPGQKEVSQQMGAYFNELADKLDAVPNTPEKLDTIVGIRDMLVEAKESIEPPAQIPGLSRNVGGRLRPRETKEVKGQVGGGTPRATSSETSRPKVLSKEAVFNPSGEKIGTITVTHDQIRQIKTNAKFKDFPDDKVAEVIRRTKLKTILDEKGFTEDQVQVKPFRPTMEPETPEAKPALVKASGERVEQPDVLTEVPTEELKPVEAAPAATPAAEAKAAKAKATKAKSEKMEPIPREFAARSPEEIQAANAPSPYISEIKPKPKAKIDPEAAFARHGDLAPIREAFDNFDMSGAPDESYKGLLPKNMRYELAEGETWQGRTKTLLDIFKMRVIDTEAEAAAAAAHEAELAAARRTLETGELPPEPEPPPPLRAKEFGKEKTEKHAGASRISQRRKWGGLSQAFKGDYPKFEASPQGQKLLEQERKAFLKRHPWALFDEE